MINYKFLWLLTFWGATMCIRKKRLRISHQSLNGSLERHSGNKFGINVLCLSFEGCDCDDGRNETDKFYGLKKEFLKI